ncbi:MAG: DUF1801 domain-containing protein [Sneathiella sp.]
MAFKNIDSLDVAAVFQSFPDEARQKLLSVRQLIFDLSNESDTVGDIEETLKWGVPSYLTKHPKSGTTIRLQWLPASRQYGIFVHCQTSLIADFKEQYQFSLKFDKNRGILFEEKEDFPEPIIKKFVSNALTYHSKK